MGCCAQDEEQSVAARWLPKVFGGLMVISAVAIMLVDWTALPGGKIRWQKLDVIDRSQGELGDLSPHGLAERVLHYGVTTGGTDEVRLTVAEYRGALGQTARSIVYPLPDTTAPKTNGQDRLRHTAWQEAADVVAKEVPADAVILGWWDDSQRLAYATGKHIWAGLPSAAGFTDRGELGLWSEVAGGLEPDDGPLRQWSRWLAMDARQAMGQIRQATAGKPVYIVVCLDDLARLDEIQALSGSAFSFESRVFPFSGDLHGQVAAIQAWAGENAMGSFLVQAMGDGSVRAWRVASEAGANTLFALLLPFTGSLADPVKDLTPVYRTRGGSYLSIFRLEPSPEPSKIQ